MGANIIDPNDIIGSDAFRANDIEGMPDLSSMYIFAELTARRRAASIIVSDGAGKTNLNNTDQDLKINFMGVDSSTNSHTTKWTRNNENAINEEGFGITDIHINVNSSYVPVVDIEFIDIRGNSLFTVGKKSQYSVLFSFPPPIFTLTVKGYYGRALQYNLHLVRQTTKFDSQSGNFIISANFVGMKYAPLTDIPFKFIDIIPLMNDNGSSKIDSVNFDPAQDPKNTRELIIRSQKLYDDVEEAKVNSQIAKDADKYRDDFNNAQQLVLSLDNFRTYMDTELQNNTISGFFIVEKQGSNDSTEGNLNNYNGGGIRSTNLNEYESLIRKNSPNQNASSLNSKLYILVDILNIPLSGNTTTDSKLVRVVKNLENVKSQIIGQASQVNSDLKDKSLISDVITNNLKGKNQDTNKDATYYGIDITKYFVKLITDVNTKKNKFNAKQEEFKAVVNDIAIKNLGKAPTIGTIFKILCDDVDVVFRKLKQVDDVAEKHHADNYDKIISSSKGTKGKISAFPLIIKNDTYNDLNPTQSGQQSTIIRSNRGYPSDVLTSLTDPFPECNFIDTFINAYLSIIKSEEAFRLKEAKDDKGNNKWIPINPFDSEILGNTSVNSPYIGKTSPIPDMISEMLNRFYVISQYSYDRQFYAERGSPVAKTLLNFFGKETLHTDLIKFISHGEAANLVNSISDTNSLKGLLTQASTWKSNLNTFYDALNENVKVKGSDGKTEINIYNTFQDGNNPSGDLFDDETNTSFLIINNGTTTITKDKKSRNFVGFNLITDDEISLRTTEDDGTNESGVNSVEKFIKEYSDDSIKNFIFDSYKFDAFTKQNIMYIQDHERIDDEYDSDFINERLTDSIYNIILIRSGDKRLDRLLSSSFSESSFIFKTILDDSNISKNVKLFLICSLFGNTASYFDKTETNVNKKFSFPAIVEVPKYAHLYMGGLTYFFRKPSDLEKEELETYNTKYGKSFIEINDSYNGAKNVEYLSQADAEKLIKYFTDYAEDTTDTGYGTLEALIINLITEVKVVNDNTPKNKSNKPTFLYDETLKRLTGNDLKSEKNTETNSFETNYNSILNKLNALVYVVNYSQKTFYPDADAQENSDDDIIPYYSDDFIALSIVNLNSTNKSVNDQYFSNFFAEIIKLVGDREKEVKQTENSIQNSINNIDIKTQLYYSMKNISDKWIMGLDGGSIMGGNKSLFEDFMFVDRAFNDISEKVVIDFKPLIEMAKDFDVSVFTVMSRILSLNGFEFFPLQNFMNFKNDDWKNTFKIFDSPKLNVADSPKFICMYVGGYSSQLDDSGDYDNDGVDDLNKLPDYKSGNVYGFDVYFAKQNQSIFTNIELNTNEHKETNESLAILSEIAQDQSASSPVGVGQNLFSTYEQRSFTCKVEMLGDIMIQPTQYFILKNIPMFRGAYIILQVEHSITPNHMRTTFTGVRMRGIPQPFVRDFSTSVGLQGGRADSGALGQVYSSIDPNLNSASLANITKDQSSRLISPT